MGRRVAQGSLQTITNDIAVAAQESGVACDAVHRSRRAATPTSRSGKECEWLKGVPEDVPDQRDREGHSSGAPLPLARATGRAARTRGADPGARHHRVIASIEIAPERNF